MKIAFHTPNLNFRGSCVALYDYAHYAEVLLGYTSIIVTDANQQSTNDAIAEDWIQRRFPVFTYTSKQNLYTLLVQKQCTVLYSIKYGTNDGIYFDDIHTIVHCVFDCSQPHGHHYVAVSQTLANKFGRTAYLPHMIRMQPGDPRHHLRAELNIPETAIVFGRHGGLDTFNLQWAKDVFSRVIREHSNLYFIFLNAVAWDDHPNIKILPATTSVSRKQAFIQTCDAMVVPETLGHTFGMSIAEFSIHHKPILCYNGPVWNRAHIDILGEEGIYFSTPDQLHHHLVTFRPDPTYRSHAYDAFTPSKVMQLFSSYLPNTLDVQSGHPLHTASKDPSG